MVLRSILVISPTAMFYVLSAACVRYLVGRRMCLFVCSVFLWIGCLCRGTLEICRLLGLGSCRSTWRFLL